MVEAEAVAVAVATASCCYVSDNNLRVQISAYFLLHFCHTLQMLVILWAGQFFSIITIEIESST